MMHNNSSLIAFFPGAQPDPVPKTLGVSDFYFSDPVGHDRAGEVSLRYRPTNLAAHAVLCERFIGLLEAMRCQRDVLKTTATVAVG